jgi:hypothetical protein
MFLIIWCILLDHGSESNLKGGRVQHKDDLCTIMITSSPSNIISAAAENYVRVVGS